MGYLCFFIRFSSSRMDRNVSDNEILQNEIELLDSMFASESCYMLDSVSSETNNSCIRIVSRTPRFVFHIELRAKGNIDQDQIGVFIFS